MAEGSQTHFTTSPRTAHSDIFPLITECLPFHGEVCKRVISFVYKCVSHNSEHIKSVSRFGVLFGRAESQVGRNIMWCLKRYRICLTEFVSGSQSPSFVTERMREFETTRTYAQLFREAIELRDDRLQFSRTELCLDSTELKHLINYISIF
jgi:hypothetical protein